MRSCKEFEELISAFLDGELPAAQRAELTGHLSGCPVCQKYFDDLVAIQEALDQEEVPVPEGFSQRVMERVRATPQALPEKKAAPSPRWRRWAAVAACCALVLAGAWGAFGGWDSVGGRQKSQAYIVTDEAPPPEPEAYCDEPEVGVEDGALRAQPAPEAPAEGYEYASGASEDRAEEKDLEEETGLIHAGGGVARAYVEGTLGLSWEEGKTYPLTEEEYLSLRDALEAAGEAYSISPSEGYGLIGE